MLDFIGFLIFWLVIIFVGGFCVYLLARLISFAILKSKDDIKHKQKEKSNGTKG